MRHIHRYIIAALAGAAMFTILYAVRERRPAADAPRLVVEQPTIELGVVLPGTTHTASIPVRNEGTAVLEVYRVDSSCGCTRAEIDRTRIPPGERALIDVEVSFSTLPGTVRNTVWITSNDPESSVATASLVAVAEWPVVPVPRNLHFPGIPSGKRVSRDVELLPAEGTVLSVVDVASSDDFIEVHRKATAHSGRLIYRIDILRDEVGPFEGMVLFRTSLTDLPVIELPVSGEVVRVPGLTVTPRMLSLGRLEAGSVSETVVTLESASSDDSHSPYIVSVDGHDWEIVDWQGEEQQPGVTRIRLAIRAPNASGPGEADVVVSTEAGGPLVRIPLMAILTPQHDSQ